MVKFEVGDKVQNIFMMRGGVVIDTDTLTGRVRVQFKDMSIGSAVRWFDKSEICKVEN